MKMNGKDKNFRTEISKISPEFFLLHPIGRKDKIKKSIIL